MYNHKFQNIQGLRAISVIAVIFFHYEINYFTGGYLGVDIFFVISGYLMSLILDVKISRKNIFNFYIKRIKRILPALVFIILVCLILGFFLLSTESYERLSRSSIFSSLFLSNFFFWREWGYFDLTSLNKPLLHTWSLSVEMQFYFVFPIILLVLNNLFKKIDIFFKLFFLFIILILVTEIFVESKKIATFYLMPFRLSEFLIGAIGYNFEKKYNNKIDNIYIFFLSLLLIVFCFYFFDKNINFPGLNSILPCFLAIVLILNKNNNLTNKILKNKLLIFLGNISYSLYLVHWPIYVFYRFFKFREIFFYEKVILIFISILFAYLIHRYIENIYRGKKKTDSLNYFSAISFLALFIITVSVISYNGLDFRMIKETIKIDTENQKIFKMDNNELSVNKCFYNSNNKNIDLNLIGDSHALMYADALIDLAKRKQINLCITTLFLDCNYFSSKKNKVYYRLNCEERKIKFSQNLISNDPSTLLVGHAWSSIKDINYENFIINFKKFQKDHLLKDKNILFFLNVPQFSNGIFSEPCSNHPKYIIKKRNCDYASRKSKIILQVESVNIEIQENLKKNNLYSVKFFDPFKFLCDKLNCKQVINDRDVYIDQDHLGSFASKLLISYWEKEILSLVYDK